MRSHRPWELFSTESVLVSQTAAEGWEKEIQNWIILFTDKALEAEPDMAAAYFLRAWAIYIVDKSDPGVMKNLRKAVVLNPNETLYSETLHVFAGGWLRLFLWYASPKPTSLMQRIWFKACIIQLLVCLERCRVNNEPGVMILW